MGQPSFRIGIDVGGTFTDVVVCAPDGVLSLQKVPTTADDVARGLLAALGASGVRGAAIGELAHGTTVATNAILERKGARTGLLTTAGFRDLLEHRDGGRRPGRGRQAAFEPLIPRDWRWEVGERLDAAGGVLEPLDAEGTRAVGTETRRQELEALAVAFLHADQNPAHETQARALLAEACPGLPIVLGSDACPFPDERLRTATAALAAYLTPLMRRYVDGIERLLRELGTQAPFRFLESAGSSCRPAEIREHPLRTILSGPAGGATAGAALAGLLQLPIAVTADMGGTSFDVALITGGTPELRGDRPLEFGLTVAVPSVDIHTAAIGGGSLIQADESLPGGLQVGPESAGATPGPACFGRGGRRPTVTDANLLLGRLIGDRTDLGLPALDLAAAEQAVLAEVCPTLGLSPAEAARAVVELTEARMAAFLRTQLNAHGVAPREAVLIAFGGAGPVQAAATARKLGLARVVVPYLASGFSALGCLLSPPARTAMAAVDEPLANVTPARLAALAETTLPGRGPGRLHLSLVLRRGDNPHEDFLAVPDPRESAAARIARYHAFTRRTYGIAPDAAQVQVVRLLAKREEGGASLELGTALEASFAAGQARVARLATAAPAPNGTPRIPVEALPLDAPAKGPALIVLPGATAYVPTGMRYRVDRWGNLIMDVEP